MPFSADIVVRVDERFDADTPIIEGRQIEKRAATRQSGTILHEFRVIDFSRIQVTLTRCFCY